MSSTPVEKPELAYRPVVQFRGDAERVGSALDDPDHRDGAVYVLPPELKLAIEVALVTGRPLLLRGSPGSGKSSLAAWVARNLEWRFYDFVVTARTRAQDLLYRFDSVRRLADAQARTKGDPDLNDNDYVEPGHLWWSINPTSARERGAEARRPVHTPATEPNADLNAGRQPGHVVLLLDEIDKADPDVPNNLLVALGSFEFMVEETGAKVRRESMKSHETMSRQLVIFTTNEERDLPDAFLRRCVVHWLETPDAALLVTIAKRHFASEVSPRARSPRRGRSGNSADLDRLATSLAEQFEKLATEARELGVRPPSTAEYLDALRACLSLRIDVTSPEWKHVERATLRKPRKPADDAPVA